MFHFLLVVGLAVPAARGDVKVSPVGRNEIVYEQGEITVCRDGKVLLGPQPVSMTLNRGRPEIELCARDDGAAYRFRTDVEYQMATAFTVKDSGLTKAQTNDLNAAWYANGLYTNTVNVADASWFGLESLTNAPSKLSVKLLRK